MPDKNPAPKYIKHSFKISILSGSSLIPTICFSRMHERVALMIRIDGYKPKMHLLKFLYSYLSDISGYLFEFDFEEL